MRIAILKTQANSTSLSPNMGYRVRYAHPNFAVGKTIHISNIQSVRLRSPNSLTHSQDRRNSLW